MERYYIAVGLRASRAVGYYDDDHFASFLDSICYWVRRMVRLMDTPRVILFYSFFFFKEKIKL